MYKPFTLQGCMGMYLGVSDQSFKNEMATRAEFSFEEACLYFLLHCRHAPDREAVDFLVTLLGLLRRFLFLQSVHPPDTEELCLVGHRYRGPMPKKNANCVKSTAQDSSNR